MYDILSFQGIPINRLYYSRLRICNSLFTCLTMNSLLQTSLLLGFRIETRALVKSVLKQNDADHHESSPGDVSWRSH